MLSFSFDGDTYDVKLYMIPLFALALWLAHTVYHGHFGPLSWYAVPHWSCRYSKLWMVWQHYYEFSPGKFGLGFRLQQEHERLGATILRYGPNHVSFAGIKAYNQIYLKNSTKLMKGKFYNVFAPLNDAFSVFQTADPILHRMRRKKLSPLFSQQSVDDFFPVIKRRFDITVDQALQQQQTHTKFCQIDRLFHSFSLDVISTLAFGVCVEAAKVDGFCHPILVSLHASLAKLPVSGHFALVNWLQKNMVPRFCRPKTFQSAINMRQLILLQLQKYDETEENDTDYPILLDSMCKPIPGQERESINNVITEALDLISAGTDTTGNTLAVTIPLIYGNRKVVEKLRNQIRTAFATKEELLSAHRSQLDQLPFLCGTVKEAIRMGNAIPGLLPRTVPLQGITILDRYFPFGTIVSSSSVLVHYDAQLFPEPNEFRPQRWLNREETELDATKETNLVQFSKGSRRCIAVTLAHAEISFAIAYLVGFYDIRIHTNQRQQRQAVGECFLLSLQGADQIELIAVNKDE